MGRRNSVFCAAALFSVVASACGRHRAAPLPAHAPPVRLADADLQRLHVDESGVLPVIEYHSIGPGHTRYDRSVAQFRADLERLYAEGYRPTSLHELLANRIECPAGTTPVLLTFDDARSTQFRYGPGGAPAPDCAVGILEAFHATHPDFPLKAVFFILPRAPFNSRTGGGRMIHDLLRSGFEVENHTVTHRALRSLSDADVQAEIAGGAAMIHALAPELTVHALALPYGSSPRNRALLAEGQSGATHYSNSAVFLVGAGPMWPPADRKFNAMAIPRILAYSGPYGVDWWLDVLKRHAARRYRSDGDPSTITVPRDHAVRIDPARLSGATLRTYG